MNVDRVVTLLVAGLLVTGCQSSAKLERASSDWTAAALAGGAASPDAAAEWAQGAAFEPARAWRAAQRHSTELRQSDAEIEKLRIDLAGVRTGVWPRLDLDTGLEMPFGEGSGGSKVYGGVFVRYDFTKAIFNADATAVAAARVQRAQMQREQVLRTLDRRLREALAELETSRARIGHLAEQQQTVAAATDIVRRLQGLGRSDAEAVWDWESRQHHVARARHAAETRRAGVAARLRGMTGFPPGRDLEPPDLAGAFPAFAEGDLPLEGQSAQAWARRADVKVAELDLFLAEMGVVEAERKGYPRFSLSAGVGEVINYTRDDASPMVVRLGVSMPLLDMGDVRRGVDRAKVGRRARREAIHQLAGEVVQRLREAREGWHRANRRMAEARSWLARQREAERQLVRANREGVGTPLAAHLGRLSRIEAEMEQDEALLELRKAALALARARGDAIPPWPGSDEH